MSNLPAKSQKKSTKAKRGQSQKVLDKPVAYTITDKAFGELEVKNSPNAWWVDREKVHNLISVFKLDGTIEEACSYAGITKGQYEYFVEQHPNFLGGIALLRPLPTLKARMKVVNSLDESYQNAMDYLKRKKHDEFGDKQTNYDVEVSLNIDV